ncbi:MAG: hypothetical protein DHS20C09_06200 [marine bacterium B5-7]|nr:MAG: hypothetical protein DHS20C09_06200 [marine bacterium B5-7]
MWKLILIIITTIVIYNWQGTNPVPIDSNISDSFPIQYASTLSIDKSPIQKDINKSKQTFQFDEFQITPLANFQLVARVLGAERYHVDRESALSPVDLALGWGPMANPATLDKLTITQSNRWYHWRTDEFPIPRRDIETNSANMHFIPANSTVATKLKSIQTGDTVKLIGYLVHVDGENGWTWTSSLTREDTGSHSCEVILLEDIKTI